MKALLLLVSLLVSGILSYASYFFGVTTLVETIIVGLLGTIALDFMILILNLDKLAISNNSELEGLQKYLDKAKLAEEYQETFSSMEKDFLEIKAAKHGPRDLFVSHLTTEIEGLQAKLSEAARRKELRIRSDFIVNVEGVFDSLSVSSDKSVKITFPIDSGEPWIGDASDQRFLEVLLDQVTSGAVSSLEVLFLLDDLSSEEESIVFKICGWLNKKSRFSAKVGTQTDFKNICALNSLDPNFIDFGIYGPEMLFRTTNAGAEHEGIYTKDSTLVARYASVFKEFWNSNTLCTTPDLDLGISGNTSFSEVCRITDQQTLLLDRKTSDNFNK